MRTWRYIHNHDNTGYINADSVMEAKKKVDTLTEGREWNDWCSAGDGCWVKTSGDNFAYLIYEGENLGC